MLLRRILLLLGLVLGGGFAKATTVPIADFFKDPEFTSVSLSPTGEYITVSVPQGDRTVLAAFRVKDMKLVGKWDYGAERHIDAVRWVNDERFFLYVTRKTGRFDFRVGTPDVYVSDVDGRRRIDIPNGGTYQIVDTLPDDPKNILVQRSVESAFLFRMDVYTGRINPVATAPVRFGSFQLDHEGNVRYVVGTEENGDTVILRRDGDTWTQIHRAAMGESTRIPRGFARDNRRVVFEVSDHGEPARLVSIDPEAEGEVLLARNPNVDPGAILRSSDRRDMIAVAFEDGLPGYEFLAKDHEEAKVYAGLINAFPEHAVSFRGVSKDGRYILFLAYSDVDPGSYYLFDRSSGRAKFLLASRSWIKPEQMSPMRPVQIPARDGTVLHGYLTVPRNSDGRNLPLILNPHGGPHGIRDSWGFNPEVQFLANRGYAVLQVNFRGSGGYGAAHERAGYRQWGRVMIDDMTDAVRWAIGQGIADKDRICSYGASYGGYAALQAVVREPDLYRCTIGYVGVYSLPLMFRDGDIPQTPSGRAYLRRVMPEGLAEQQAQSPAYNIDRINIPVMLVHGAKDQRVPMSHYRLLLDRLTEAGKPPQDTLVKEKEGHGFYDFNNQVELYTRMQAFLDQHIGQVRKDAGAGASP
ncbi:MAG: peptidase S9 [Silanimonas sp.]|nr:MAG: peptidase S9 [Silanimonas sp.]